MGTDSNTPRGTETRPAAEDARRERERSGSEEHPSTYPSGLEPTSPAPAGEPPTISQKPPSLNPSQHSTQPPRDSPAEQSGRGEKGKE